MADYTLALDNEETIDLDISAEVLAEAGGLTALNGRRVTVEILPGQGVETGERVTVTSIELADSTPESP